MSQNLAVNRYRLLLVNFGAYLVDDTAWDVYAIVTEWSPEGRFAEEFEKKLGIFDKRLK